MGMNATVVRINADTPAQREQFEALFNEYSSAHSEGFVSAVVGQLFELPYFHGFMCYEGGEAAAVAVCFESFSTHRARKVLIIHDFMVSSGHRGKGVGKALLNGYGVDKNRELAVIYLELAAAQDNETARDILAGM